MDSAGRFDHLIKSTERQRYQSSRGASVYDFRQKDKFTSDQNRFLHQLFRTFAESVVTQLAPLLQARFQMELISFKLRSYHSYLNSLPEPTPVMVFHIGQEASGFIDLDYELAFSMFERLMGGKGSPPRDKIRSYFTDLEKRILQVPLLRMLVAYSHAWKDVKEVECHFATLEFNPNAVYICSPSETMVVSTYQVDVARAQGLMNLVLPFKYLKETIPRQSFDEFILTKAPTANSSQNVAPIFAKNLEKARVPVSVSLGRAELLFQELLSVEVGDTIRLDSDIQAPLKIKVNGKTKFLGQPGIKDNKLACKITKVLEEGDEEFDE